MELRKNLKKAVVGVALAGALLGNGFSGESKTEIKSTEAKMEQRTKKSKSDIQQKISYFDEFVAAVESGKDKELAYREFIIKIADENAEVVKQIEEQMRVMQQKQQKTEFALLLCFAISGFLFLKNNFHFDLDFKKLTSKKSNEPYKKSEMGFREKN